MNVLYLLCINGKKGDICKLVHKSHMEWQKGAKVTRNGKKGLKIVYERYKSHMEWQKGAKDCICAL